MSSSSEELVNKLRKALDLTLYEAKLYLALLQGAKDPKDASAKSGVPLPRIYDVVKVLESKGLVYKEPGGWYAPLSPSSMAVAMVAKIEDEMRRRIREVMEVSRALESAYLASPPRREGLVMARGTFNLIGLALDTFRNSGLVYVTVVRYLADQRLLLDIIKSLSPYVGEIRVAALPSLDLDGLPPIPGVSVKRLGSVYVDSIVSDGSLMIMLSDQREGELVGLVTSDGELARKALQSLDAAWRSG